MENIVITSQPLSASVVPEQNTTFSASVAQQTATSNNEVLAFNTGTGGASRFAKFARGSESGEKRFRRLRNLGYI